MRPAARLAFRSIRRPLGLLALTAGCLLVAAAPHAQQATFRSGVDLIAVDTQVIDRDGQPIDKLTARDFQVWVNGHDRRVVSADLVQYPLLRPMAFAPLGGERPAWISGDLPEVRGRIFIVAVDEMSFTTASMQRAVQAARRFIGSLRPEDVVGLYAYPLGTGQLDLTHYHATVSQRLDHLQAMLQPFNGDFQLSPSEIVDLTARDSIVMNHAILRECPLTDQMQRQIASGSARIDEFTVVNANSMLKDPSCPARLQSEANARALYEESQTTQSFYGLRNLMQGLAGLPGPKTVVLLSGGMLSSDRVGGRPDVSTLLKTAGRDAAEADAMLYVLHFDTSYLDVYSAVNGPSHNPADLFLTNARDGNTLALGLQQVAGEAGGEYIRMTAGDGQLQFNRVLRETGAYYLLGVQPDAADRDGRAHFIRVKANIKGATVHSRSQVTIPKPKNAGF